MTADQMPPLPEFDAWAAQFDVTKLSPDGWPQEYARAAWMASRAYAEQQKARGDEAMRRVLQLVEWNKELRAKLEAAEQQTAELRRDVMALASLIDPFDTSPEDYALLRKYIPDYPEKHPMETA